MILYLPFVHHKVIVNKVKLAIGVLWLFNFSAMIGISLGYQEWFLSKTAFNLFLQLGLLVWVFPIKRLKNFLLFLTLFLLGMGLEIVGVQTGFLFGEYSYGSNLGITVYGVPLIIGCNWAVLVFTGATLSNLVSQNIWIKSLIGASLMILLDIPMELVAPHFDYWTFVGHVPVFNFLCWFVIGFFMHVLVHFFRLKGSTEYSVHLYASQFLFFIYFAFLL